MAYRLAIMRPGQWESILQTERAFLKTDDQRKEFDYICRACNPSEPDRTRLFNMLLKPEGRVQEPWAIHALRLLNSDVFEPKSNIYIEPSLKSLEFIQQTSDIFFPDNWAKALFAEHKSDEARQIVKRYFQNNPDYPENLKNKVAEATWTLMKQVPYVEKSKSKTISTKTEKSKGKTTVIKNSTPTKRKK